MLAAAWITAVATGLLAVLAGFTAWYARKAFREQSREVRAIEQQVHDQEELTRQQAELLKVQSGQLGLQRQQAEDQRQAEVLKLQATELSESVAERKREAGERRQSQASRVFIWQDNATARQDILRVSLVTAHVTNTSDQPIYDVELLWHRGSEPYGDPNPQPLGTIMPNSEHPGSHKASQKVQTMTSAAQSCGSVTPPGHMDAQTGRRPDRAATVPEVASNGVSGGPG